MKEIKAFPNRKWVIKVAIGFLIVMGLLTFFSNTIMNYSLPQVTVAYSSGGSMTSVIKGTGTITAQNQSKETAKGARKIDVVFFGVNEEVLEGDVLASLAPVTEEEQADLKAAQAALKTLLDQKITDELQTPVYDYSMQERAIADAQELLNKAVLALTTSSDAELKTAKAELKALVDAKTTEDLQAPVYDYTKLQRVIDDALTALNKTYTTLNQANSKANAILTAQAAVNTAKANVGVANSDLGILVASKTDLELKAGVAKNEYDAATDAADKAAKKLVWDDFKTKLQTTNNQIAGQNVNIVSLETAFETANANLATANALPTPADASEAVLNAQEDYNAAVKALADQKKADGVAQQISGMSAADKAQALTDAQKKVDDLTSLSAFKTSLTALGTPAAVIAAAQTVPALADQVAAVESAKRSYEDAEKALTAQMKADSITQQIAALSVADKKKAIDDAQKKVDELTAFTELTNITAAKSGRISAVNIASGVETVKGDVMVIIDVIGDGFTVPITFTTLQISQMNIGMGARLDNYGGTEEDATLVSIKPDATDPRNKKIGTFKLNDPDNQYWFTSGSSVTLSLNNRSKDYQCIVPLSAIHEESGETFLYSIKEKSSPLGTRYIAVKVPVTILAKDDTNAAIDPSALGEYGSRVITESNDKSFKSGDQVRLAEGL